MLVRLDSRRERVVGAGRARRGGAVRVHAFMCALTFSVVILFKSRQFLVLLDCQYPHV